MGPVLLVGLAGLVGGIGIDGGGRTNVEDGDGILDGILDEPVFVGGAIRMLGLSFPFPDVPTGE